MQDFLWKSCVIMGTMKLRIEQDDQYKELEIHITYDQKDKLIERILGFLETVDRKLSCYQEGPLFNSRMEATLLNGERVIVNRRYLPDVKEALKGIR